MTDVRDWKALGEHMTDLSRVLKDYCDANGFDGCRMSVEVHDYREDYGQLILIPAKAQEFH